MVVIHYIAIYSFLSLTPHDTLYSSPTRFTLSTTSA